jgi:1,4-dihydroxy-2-naphthoyl-CoA hydrolase
MDAIEEMKATFAGRLPDTLGVVITDATKDAVEATLLVREEICTTGHILHGGSIMAFADTLGAVGTSLNLRDGQGTTTLESKTNFFAGAKLGETVRARSVPLHRGRRTMVWQTTLTNEAGKLVAQVTQTQMVLEG